MNRNRPQQLELQALVLGLVLGITGCAHRVHVEPVSAASTSHPIPHTLRVAVPFLALEGADHMPGIGLLEWPAKDLQAATVGYIRQRGTFSSVTDETGSYTLTIKAWLVLRSREAYLYNLRLESDLSPSGQPPVKSYLVQKQAMGSAVRWTTASDQQPINATVQGALDDLLTQIEADALRFGTK